MRGSFALSRLAWAITGAAGFVLVGAGLGQTLYFGTAANAFERDRAGNTLILAGSALGLAVAGWSLYRRDPRWVSILVAAPAVIVGGLNFVAGESLLPHLAALAAVPMGLAGIVGGVMAGSRRVRS